jgi:hypothetical protein
VDVAIRCGYKCYMVSLHRSHGRKSLRGRSRIHRTRIGYRPIDSLLRCPRPGYQTLQNGTYSTRTSSCFKNTKLIVLYTSDESNMSGNRLSSNRRVTVARSSFLLSTIELKAEVYINSCCNRLRFALKKSSISPRHSLVLMIRESVKKKGLFTGDAISTRCVLC